MPAAYREHGSSGSTGGTLTAAAAASLASPGDSELLAINNLLGFIKTRKLAGVARQAVSRRSSSGSMASAHGSQAGGSAAGGGGAAAVGTAGQGRRVWIQPSGECVESDYAEVQPVERSQVDTGVYVPAVVWCVQQVCWWAVPSPTSVPQVSHKCPTAPDVHQHMLDGCGLRQLPAVFPVSVTADTLSCAAARKLRLFPACIYCCQSMLASTPPTPPDSALPAAAAAARSVAAAAGPRRAGEGVENEEQGILSAEEVPTTG
jgi:hypothetical protein